MLNNLLNRSKKYNHIRISQHPTISPVQPNKHLKRVDVAPLLNQAIQKLHPIVQSKKIQLNTHLAKDCLFAETEASSFYRLAYNLIGHSLRQAPAGGIVTVSARQIGLDFELTVHNNGSAMTPEEVNFLFAINEFGNSNRADISNGMGLDCVKQIVDAHQGLFFVESRSGRGCMFIIRLPMVGDVYH